ncbi:hypothetical protein GCM10027093_19410 [Paraburkholderia jirisanensis]
MLAVPGAGEGELPAPALAKSATTDLLKGDDVVYRLKPDNASRAARVGVAAKSSA